MRRHLPAIAAAAFALSALPVTPSSVAHASPRPLNRQEVADGLSLLVSVGELARVDSDRARVKHALPQPATTLVTHGASVPKCATTQLVQARRWAAEHGLQLHDPAPPATYVESSTLPNLRVYYGSDSGIDEANKALMYLEKAWRKQVIELGYNAPHTPTDSGPQEGQYLTMVAPNEHFLGLTRPQGDVPSTPRCDCSTDLQVVTGLSDEELESTINHEFNHATQGATDCGETISAWENFATAVQFDLSGRQDRTVEYMISQFQDYPEYPLDYWSNPNYSSGDGPSGYYQYGASLFPLFLKDRFGPDDPAFLRKVWNSFAQDGTYVFNGMMAYCDPGNDPDWFQGLDRFLQGYGSNLKSAFVEFAQWRAIVSTEDDGYHFRQGSTFAAPRLKVMGDPLPAKRSYDDFHEFGSRYLRLLPDPMPAGIEVKLTCDPEASWSASFLLWRAGQQTEVVPVAFDGASARGSVPSLSGIDRAVLVVSQLDDGQHRTDDGDYTTVRSCDYAFSALGPAGADAGSQIPPATAEGAAASGCGCGQTSAGAAAPMLVAAAAVGLALAKARRRASGR